MANTKEDIRERISKLDAALQDALNELEALDILVEKSFEPTGPTREVLTPDDQRNVLRLADWLDNIYASFDWDDSVKGPIYWSEVYENLFGLVDSDAVDDYHEGDRDLPLTFSAARSLLSSSFIWSETPQGWDYWSEVHRGLAKESPATDSDSSWL